MLKNGFWTLIYRVLGAALTLGSTILFARLLGALEFGLLNLGLTTITIVCLIVRSGLDNVALKQVSAHFPEQRGIVDSYIAVILRVVLSLGILFTVLVYVMADIIAIELFSKPKFEEVLRIFSFLIIPMSLSYVLSEINKALGRPMFSAFGHGVLPISITLTLVWFVSVTSDNELSKILLAIIAGFLVSVITYLYSIRAYIVSRSKCYLTSLSVLKEGIPMLSVSSGALVMAWSDIMILGIYSSADNIGIYSAASRLVMATTIILIAVNAVTVPKYAKYYKTGDIAAIEKLARAAAVVLLLVVSIPMMILMFFSDWIMLLFGEEFSGGEQVLRVLAIGQFVNVICGSVAYLLIMTGKEEVLRNIYFVTAILNIFLSIILLKIWGVIGVAYATSFSVIMWNILAAYIVKKHLGFWSFRPGSLMELKGL